MHIWKQRLGSNATYQRLIDVFERAGYCTYAEIVRNIVTACNVESEMDLSDCDESLLQPDTYPHPEPSPPTSPMSKHLTHEFSSCDEYLQINQAAVQDLPEGDLGTRAGDRSS